MRLRVFKELETVVGDSKDESAKEELKWLLKLARTNFAACYGTGTHGPDGYDAATCALSARLPPLTGGGRYVQQICDWLYAPAREKCTCGAPAFITGCDNAIVSGDEGADSCECRTGECPWTRHTGVFL